MEQTIYTVKLATGEETLAAAAQKLRIEPADLDPDFGVVPVAPAEGLYAVLVAGTASPETDGFITDGPFANPPIATFGPPKS
jgi:hypothetical protein